MKMRAGFLATCAASALVIGMGFASPALAADQMVTKAPAAEPLQWWYEGFIEVGGRFNLNNPDKRTLGKFYEYRDLRPGVFGNFYIAAHRNNPIDIAFWGKNVGWNDQAFGFDFAKPGEHYFSAQWDETPHVFWKNAKTLYDGVGTNNLTIPIFLTPPPGPGPAAAIAANSKTIDIGIRRDTASAQYRWTPTDNWDVNVDYSHLRRQGTQPLGAVSFSNINTRSTFELPKPVDDVTQNGNIKGEYAGSTPWGKPFNVALGYGFSLYNNAYDALVFQNPWNAVNTAGAPLNNRYSLAPDNKAQTLSVSGGIGLPWNSRYMGTFQYTKMQQQDSILPWTINPLVTAPDFTTQNRDVNTTLFNNVLNTQITADLKSTLRYRYYDFRYSNNSPVTVVGPWYANPDTNTGAEDTEITYPKSYTKQNASAELAWRAVKWLNVGAGYDWERWDRNYRDTAVTNENIVKVFADSKWAVWSTMRASLQYGERRYDQYVTMVEVNSDAMRMKDLANRDRFKGMVSWAVDVTPMITVTPNGGFLNDDYKTDILARPEAEIGLKHTRSWNVGTDVAFNVNRNAALYVSYNYESSYRQVYQNGPDPDLNIESRDGIHTFIIGSKVALIPEKLLVDANYTWTRSTSKWDLSCGPFGCRYSPLATFPDSNNTLQRLDVQAKYFLDDSWVRSFGWAGKAFVKARVLWERNSSDAWQPLQNQLGWLVNPSATTAYSIWLGTGNPNYDVVLGQLSFGVKW